MGRRERKHREKLEAWKKWIAECMASRIPVRQWCEKKGCSTTTFYRWKREIVGTGEKKQERRKTVLTHPEVEASKPAVVLAEVPVTQCAGRSEEAMEKQFHPAAIIRVGRISIELSEELAQQVVKQMEVRMRC